MILRSVSKICDSVTIILTGHPSTIVPLVKHMTVRSARVNSSKPGIVDAISRSRQGFYHPVFLDHTCGPHAADLWQPVLCKQAVIFALKPTNVAVPVLMREASIEFVHDVFPEVTSINAQVPKRSALSAFAIQS